MGQVISTKTCNISEKVQDRSHRTKIIYYDGQEVAYTLSIRYQNQWPWMTLNGWNALLRKKLLRTSKIWMKIDPKCQWQNVRRSMILVSRKVCANIRRGDSGDEWQCWGSRKRRCSDLSFKIRAHTTVTRSPSSAFQWSKMRDLEWPLNVIQGVLCWLWRQMRPRRRGCRV